jgi:single-strand DNA-binding protein
MVDFNTVSIEGRAVRDAELRSGKEGKSVATFSIANEDYKKETSFFNVVVFGKTAELAKYITTGKTVIVNGRLKQRKYDKDGETRYTVEILAYDIYLRQGKNTERLGRDDTLPDDTIVDKPIDLSEIPF